MGDTNQPLTPSGGTSVLEDVQEKTSPDTPWQTILHNDPVNLTGYVTRVLMKVLKCDEAKAEHLMMTAHIEGKAAVFDGSREECEDIANQLTAKTLWATIDKSGS